MLRYDQVDFNNFPKELEEEESFEYKYYYFTKRAYGDYTNDPSNVVPNKEENKFIIYLDINSYNKMKYKSSQFISEYCGISIEYKLKKNKK
jgi:hypothetical protein